MKTLIDPFFSLDKPSGFSVFAFPNSNQDCCSLLFACSITAHVRRNLYAVTIIKSIYVDC